MLDKDDYLLIQRGNDLYKFPISKFNLKYALIGETPQLDELEEKIYDLSATLLGLSADILNDYNKRSLSSLLLEFETLSSANLIKQRSDILTEYEVETLIKDRNIVLKDEMEDAYRDTVNTKAMNAFDDASDKIYEVMND